MGEGAEGGVVRAALTDDEIEAIAHEAWDAAIGADPAGHGISPWNKMTSAEREEEDGPVGSIQRLLDGRRTDEEEVDEWCCPEAGRAFVRAVRARIGQGRARGGRCVSSGGTCAKCGEPKDVMTGGCSDASCSEYLGWR